MYRYKPSRAARAQFAAQMTEIEAFCAEHNISASRSNDSYYFRLNGKNYRISNHSVESSNARAVNDLGEKLRDAYHPDGREADTIYIHAGKTRIIDIYNDLAAGYELDGRGNRK